MWRDAAHKTINVSNPNPNKDSSIADVLMPYPLLSVDDHDLVSRIFAGATLRGCTPGTSLRTLSPRGQW